MPAFVIAWIASFSIVFRIGDDAPNLREALRGNGVVSYDRLDRNYRHALAERGFAGQWLACFHTPTTGREDARLKDTLKKFHLHVATTNWEELGEVEAFLRSRDVKDRELVCWDEGVHPLYLSLGIRPGLRFMHIHNADRIGPDSVAKIRAELHPNRAIRFVVSDLEWVAYVTGPYKDHIQTVHTGRYPPGRSPDNPVPVMDEPWNEVFPYDGRKAVFRSQGGLGRYIVFEVSQPLGKVE